jgi:hypothetical protein
MDNPGGNAITAVQIVLETAFGLCSPSDKIIDAVNASSREKKKRKILNTALRELMLRIGYGDNIHSRIVLVRTRSE